MDINKLQQQVGEYARGKTWYWYVPVWLFGLYLFVNLLGYDPDQPMPLPITIGQSFDFLLHEMAHIVTAFLPAILTAAAGSLSEILLGTVLVAAAFKTRSYMTSLICCLWFMLACQSAGVYMADARAQKLELVSLGAMLSGSDEATHDWHFVFGQLHILNFDTFIGNSVRSVGIVVGLFGLAFTAWVIYLMWQSRGLPATSKPLTDEESMMVMKAAADARKASEQH
jgi:hypothetical protein